MGLFIIEGIDGSGKSTQIDMLEKRLISEGYKTKKLKFPNYEDRSSSLVKMYLEGEFGTDPESVNAYAASSFYAVDRYASYKKYWEKEYLNGTVIVADRYVLSNVIHQGSKLSESEMESYCEWLYDYEFGKLGIPEPDMSFYLDVPPEVAMRGVESRYDGDENKKDIHEKDIEYMCKCYRAGIKTCDLLGVQKIECLQDGKLKSPKEINNIIYRKIINLLKG